MRLEGVCACQGSCQVRKERPHELLNAERKTRSLDCIMEPIVPGNPACFLLAEVIKQSCEKRMPWLELLPKA